MKITGGKFRGKNIEARQERTLRPTSGRIRESIFNILQHGRFFKHDDFIEDDNPSLVEDRRVIDIFCGTGALGIEALSRGATHLTLVDQNAATLSIAQKNVSQLGESILANTQFIRSDSTQLPIAPKPCKLAFIDPPYGRNLVLPALSSLVEQGWLTHGSIVVIEHEKRDGLIVPECFTLLDERVHDKTKLTLLQYKSAS